MPDGPMHRRAARQGGGGWRRARPAGAREALRPLAHCIANMKTLSDVSLLTCPRSLICPPFASWGCDIKKEMENVASRKASKKQEAHDKQQAGAEQSNLVTAEVLFRLRRLALRHRSGFINSSSGNPTKITLPYHLSSPTPSATSGIAIGVPDERRQDGGPEDHDHGSSGRHQGNHPCPGH